MLNRTRQTMARHRCHWAARAPEVTWCASSCRSLWHRNVEQTTRCGRRYCCRLAVNCRHSAEDRQSWHEARGTLRGPWTVYWHLSWVRYWSVDVEFLTRCRKMSSCVETSVQVLVYPVVTKRLRLLQQYYTDK